MPDEIVQLTTWNIESGVANCLSALIDLDSDIYLLQECGNEAEVDLLRGGFHCVRGGPRRKGLAIAVKDGWTVGSKEHLGLNTLRAEVVSPSGRRLQVLNFWALSSEFGLGTYLQQASSLKEALVNGEPLDAFGGDFNTTGRSNFNELFREYEALGFKSAYHRHFGEEYGSESLPTLFHQHKQDQPFHCDLLFISNAHRSSQLDLGDLKSVALTKPFLSDHLPVTSKLEIR
jgi:hypothetical protein